MARGRVVRFIVTGFIIALLNGVAFAAENQAPVVLLPSPLPSGSPNTIIDIANNIGVSDPDAANFSFLTLTVTATNGRFQWSFDPLPQTSDTTTATLASLNTALDDMTFIPNTGFAGTAILQLTINDNGNTGTGGAKTDTAQFAITVCTPAEIASPTTCQTNNGPQNSVGGTRETGLITTIVINTSISDPDVGGGVMEQELNVAHHDPIAGAFTADRVGRFTWDYGTAVTTDLAIDTLSDLNTALSNLTFTPAQGFAGQARIVYEIDDQANSDNDPSNDSDPNASLADTDSVIINVCIPSEMPSALGGNTIPCETNNPPSNVLPAIPPDTTTNTAVGIPMSVSDVDVGTGTMEMEINVFDHANVLTPAQVGTISWAYGTSVTEDVAVDTIGNMNAALANLIFTPAAGFTGQARIVMEIDDRGNSGSDTNSLTNIIKADTVFIVVDVLAPANTTFTAGMQGHPAAPNTALQQTVDVLITRAGVATPIFDSTRATTPSGTFVINNLPPGTYRLRIKGEHSISSAQDITLAAGSNSITLTVPLREGDANDDNVVNLTDFSLLASAFGSVPGNPNFNANADFNDDGLVQLADFSLLATNFAQSGTN